jgi:hypothetical protein
VAQSPIFSPTELAIITDCTLHYYFWQQSPLLAETTPLETVVRDTIAQLHAAGGPHRLNLPATLRQMTQFIPETQQTNVPFQMAARQMVANYHRRLKEEWVKVIASNEAMALALRLRRSTVRVETVVDRVDREQDGGITVVNFRPAPEPIPEQDLETDTETTLLHALVAAAYPDKRPVRIKYLWLYHNQEDVVELTEKQYRANLEKVRARAQAWVEGEILARPGPYCAACPFKYQGCPIYQNEQNEGPGDLAAEDTKSASSDLPESSPPATLLP